MTETIKDIPLDELHPFPDPPFGVRDDDAMLGIMMEQKKPENWDLKFPMDKIRRLFSFFDVFGRKPTLRSSTRNRTAR